MFNSDNSPFEISGVIISVYRWEHWIAGGVSDLAQVKQLVGSRAGIWCLVSKPMAKDYTAQPHGDVTKMLLCVRHFVTLPAEFHITLPAIPPGAMTISTLQMKKLRLRGTRELGERPQLLSGGDRAGLRSFWPQIYSLLTVPCFAFVCYFLSSFTLIAWLQVPDYFGNILEIVIRWKTMLDMSSTITTHSKL